MERLLPGDVMASRRVAWKEEGGLVTLLVPRFSETRWGRFLRRLFGESTVRIKLDELGSFVWKNLDGRTTLERVAQELSSKFEDKADHARERVELFLTKLYREGWICLARKVNVHGAGSARDEVGRE